MVGPRTPSPVEESKIQFPIYNVKQYKFKVEYDAESLRNIDEAEEFELEDQDQDQGIYEPQTPPDSPRNGPASTSGGVDANNNNQGSSGSSMDELDDSIGNGGSGSDGLNDGPSPITRQPISCVTSANASKVNLYFNVSASPSQATAIHSSNSNHYDTNIDCQQKPTSPEMQAEQPLTPASSKQEVCSDSYDDGPVANCCADPNVMNTATSPELVSAWLGSCRLPLFHYN